MFGLFRTYLAVCVAASHLMGLSDIGHYAVHGFFILSGYLMATIMAGVYGYTPRGTVTFLLNRALRLYPSYWVVLALTVILIGITGEEASNTFRISMTLPRTAGEWLANLTMIYPAWVPSDIKPRLSPATWALTIELFYYALIGIGLMRWRSLTWAVFGLSLAYHAATILGGYGFVSRYSFLPAGALAFSAGGLIFHYRYLLERYSLSLRATYLIFIPLFAALPVLADRLDAMGLTYPSAGIFYVNLLLNALAVASLAKPSQRLNTRADRFIGDFSYHLYIAHWAVGFAVAYFFLGLPGPARGQAGLELLLLTLALSALLSLLLRTLVDAPVERLRSAAKRAREPSAAWAP